MSRRRKPSEIRFSQDSIKNHWKDNSCQIGETLDQLLKGEIIVDDIEKNNCQYKKWKPLFCRQQTTLGFSKT